MPDGLGGFVSPRGDYATLIDDGGGLFHRRLKNGTTIHFDAAGRHTSSVDRNGRTTTYSYASGLLSSIEDAAGRLTSFDYLGGKLRTITDPVGRITTLDIDANGDLTSFTQPDTTVRSFSYEAGTHLMTSQTDERGDVTSYVFENGHISRSVRSNFDASGASFEEIWELDPIRTVALPPAGTGTAGNPAPTRHQIPRPYSRPSVRRPHPSSCEGERENVPAVGRCSGEKASPMATTVAPALEPGCGSRPCFA